MKEYLDHFIDHICAIKNYSEKTAIAYRKDLEEFFINENIQTPFEITERKILEFLSGLARTGNKPKTRNRKLSSIRSFCKFLKGQGVITINPSSEIEIAKVDRTIPTVFSEKEVGDIIDSAETLKDKALLEVMYATGCRVDELVTIKKTDINIPEKLIRIFGKGSKERIVPISQGAINAIIAYVSTHKHDSIYIFPSEKDYSTHISDRSVRYITERYAGKVGITGRKVSPHIFRHTCATHLHDRGVDIRYLQEFLGHADLSTTEIYTHISANHLSEVYHGSHPRA